MIIMMGRLTCWEAPMREWLLAVFPLTVVLYFLVFPEQLGPTIEWVRSAADWVTASVQ